MPDSFDMFCHKNNISIEQQYLLLMEYLVSRMSGEEELAKFDDDLMAYARKAIPDAA